MYGTFGLSYVAGRIALLGFTTLREEPSVTTKTDACDLQYVHSLVRVRCLVPGVRCQVPGVRFLGASETALGRLHGAS